MKHTIMPGYLPDGPAGRKAPMHVSVEFTDGRMSISGVVGARASGGCYGSAGQCLDELLREDFILAQNWTKDMVKKLHDIWGRWHLNDMSPMCEHQRAAGWKALAGKEVKTYKWALKHDAYEGQRSLKKRIVEDYAAKGEAYEPTLHDVELLNLDNFIDTYTDTLTEPQSRYYEPVSGSGVYPHVNKSKAGHTYHEGYTCATHTKHPDGLLCKPCPVCGYEYGSKWLREEVPEDVIKWLLSLPKAEKPCPWGEA